VTQQYQAQVDQQCKDQVAHQQAQLDHQQAQLDHQQVQLDRQWAQTTARAAKASNLLPPELLFEPIDDPVVLVDDPVVLVDDPVVLVDEPLDPCIVDPLVLDTAESLIGVTLLPPDTESILVGLLAEALLKDGLVYVVVLVLTLSIFV
jgi:hypothetical protein